MTLLTPPWCTVTFPHENHARRRCVFTYRQTVNGVPGPLRCSNCGRAERGQS